MSKIVPDNWMPDARIERIIVHWTAGGPMATATDSKHYHILIGQSGNLVRGRPTIDGNGIGSKSGIRASHTLNCNTGSIGVSLCGMAGAKEGGPYGAFPINRVQWEKLAQVVADLAKRYDVPVSAKTILSHAEVQANLGIRQRGKWDIAILPFAPAFNTAAECGAELRRMVAAHLQEQ